MFIKYNPNPVNRNVSDCAVRAVAKALDVSWGKAYNLIANAGYLMGDMPHSNSVWGAVLREHGFKRHIVPNSCPDCYTVKEFCEDHPQGVFVIGTSNHVVTAIDGDYYDSWDSGNEIPLYYWWR